MKFSCARQERCHVGCWAVVVIVMTMGLMSACQEPYSTDISGTEQAEVSSARILLSDALNELNAVLVNLEGKTAINGTRSAASTRAIRTVQLVGDPKVKQVYIVNFAENKGYAILAADRSVQDPVIAVTDEGSLSESEFNCANETSPLGMLVSLVKKYLKAGTLNDQNSNLAETSFSTSSLATEEAWQTTKKLNPMLVTLWGQGTPFNTFCPRKRWTIFQSYKLAPAGCVPIAIAQIMTYHAFPENLVSKGISIDWQSLQKMALFVENDSIQYVPPTNTQQFMAAALLYQIGLNCHSIYTHDWTFTFPANAKDCFRRMSYSNVQLYNGYAESKILEMLDDSCPVFVSAISGLKGGHAWVIDGMITQTRQINGHTQNRTLMHCNFGWYGQANGYYISNLFYTKEGSLVRNAYETVLGSKSIYDYNGFFNTITYSRPGNPDL